MPYAAGHFAVSTGAGTRAVRYRTRTGLGGWRTACQGGLRVGYSLAARASLGATTKRGGTLALAFLAISASAFDARESSIDLTSAFPK